MITLILILLNAKRVFTKDILMRIDLYKLAMNLSIKFIQEQLDIINIKYNFNYNLSLWDSFLHEMAPAGEIQNSLFEIN